MHVNNKSFVGKDCILEYLFGFFQKWLVRIISLAVMTEHELGCIGILCGQCSFLCCGVQIFYCFLLKVLSISGFMVE